MDIGSGGLLFNSEVQLSKACSTSGYNVSVIVDTMQYIATQYHTMQHDIYRTYHDTLILYNKIYYAVTIPTTITITSK